MSAVFAAATNMKLTGHTLTMTCVRLWCLALLWPHVQGLSCSKVPPSAPNRTFDSCSAKCTNLKTRDLRNTLLENIPDGEFANHSCIGQLDLSQNQLSKLSNRTFEGLVCLSALNLSSNKLAALSADAFRPLSALHFLDLSFNLIEVVGTALFEGTPGLQVLNVSHNRIKILSSFDGLVELKELRLDHNAIGMFHAGYFSSNAALVRLDLTQNQLVIADFHVNASWPNLKLLNLSSNFLNTLDLTDIRELFAKTGTCLDLHNNTLACDKLEALFKDSVESKFCVWPGPLSTCVAPLHNSEKSLSEGTERPKTQAFTFKYIAIALTLIGTAFCLMLLYERCNRAELHRLWSPVRRGDSALVDDMDYVRLETAF